MNYTTGLTDIQFDHLLALVTAMDPKPQLPRGRKQVFSLEQKLLITLAYLRSNRTQSELAETYHAHQTTISDIIITYTDIIAQALNHIIPTVDDLDPSQQLILDGTITPSWSWKTHPEDYSGKHKTTGRNLQVAATLTGHLAWVSDPMPGSTHDTAALQASGLLDRPNHPAHIADKGYQGQGLITPIKKKPSWDKLPDHIKTLNRQIGQIRYIIEQTIAHLKTWRILHTDYRRPHHTHPQTITAVIGLQFLRTSFP